ncbi:DUF6773 family protein [Sutcliffiella deserti]|uniref:DUF6773 family protein n=1 Tax=Sutcliffiella deserti TaxID=2875501 RepID=UPI001CBBC6FA|nr:DUF6773 family protein [Sutcliffiella deserti]
MGLFRGTGKVIDERLVNMQNKVYREMYVLVLVICIVSIGVKIFFNGTNISNIATEVIILIAQGIYYMARASSLGIFTDEVEMHDRKSKTSMKMKNVWGALVGGFAIALFFGIMSAINYADNTQESITFFFSVFFVSLLIYLPFFLILFGGTFLAAKKNSDRVVNKELQEDEEDKR